jgi:tryptophan synthase beta chain
MRKEELSMSTTAKSGRLDVPARIVLTEKEIPQAYYNVVADFVHPMAPALNPGTREPLKVDDLLPIFPRTIAEQELTTERYIDIPDDVRRKYAMFRPSSLHRAYALEEALGTPARIYYKYEGGNTSGSHKLNSALAQVYYNKEAGVKRISTETGAGQWGTALAMACSMYDVECVVYMVRVSYEQKPYRKSLMKTFGATVYASPSEMTEVGRVALKADPNTPGSLGLAISEAVEDAVTTPGTKYSLGSVLNHVILHQTVIGQEAKAQLASVDEYPDIVIGCCGGGTNFSGIAMPFVQDKIKSGKQTRLIAVEPTACPSLTKGVFAYDFGDTAMLTPLLKQYTLGHNFIPSGIHAGGLRYHGASGIVSHLKNEGVIEATAVPQDEVFKAALTFARCEGIIPAPESSHAICQTLKEAAICRETGEEKVILFSLSGHGLLDMAAYERYLEGDITDQVYTDEMLAEGLKCLPEV